MACLSGDRQMSEPEYLKTKVAGRLKNSISLFIGSTPGAVSRSGDQAIDAVATRT